MSTSPGTGWSDITTFLLILVLVLAFTGLSLVISASGTARFAAAMGYPERVGLLVGGMFDLAKAIIPIWLAALFSLRKWISFLVIGAAWIGLCVYSLLATHATVGLAISERERTATWQMENRSDARAELQTIEQRIAVLSKWGPPRPAQTVEEALAREKVPKGIWNKSDECRKKHLSRYFQKACAHVLNLRVELAAAKDYERLSLRARDLRETLAASPIIATSDPLPMSFEATIGRVVPVDGRAGIAFLLTVFTEILSCFGLAILRDSYSRKALPIETTTDPIPSHVNREHPRGHLRGTKSARPTTQIIPHVDGVDTSLPDRPTGQGISKSLTRANSRARGRPNAVKAGATGEGSVNPPKVPVTANVSAFVRTRLRRSEGQSVGATDLYVAYKAWCLAMGEMPLSQQKLGTELKRLNLAKRKSNGLIRYCDVALVA